MRCRKYLIGALVVAWLLTGQPGAAVATDYDLIIRGGTVYDGSGLPPVQADVAIASGRIVAIGDLAGASTEKELDARGMAVAPGFINMLSWATESLIEDGRGLSDVRQGVTLEVFGEGWSMGPVSPAMKLEMVRLQGDIQYDIAWTSLGDYLEYLEHRGVSVNVASFVGATTVRIHELGEADRAPSPEELGRMKTLVKNAMEEGALGLGSSLIYAPAFYAKTDELIELARVAGAHGGMYISHMRSEGNRLLEAVDELVSIAEGWEKIGQVFERVEAARDRGLRITADMYTYTAGATGLDAAMPPWVQEGGLDA
jgi:N-acyl-D-amino-acid deacylase